MSVTGGVLRGATTTGRGKKGVKAQSHLVSSFDGGTHVTRGCFLVTFTLCNTSIHEQLLS